MLARLSRISFIVLRATFQPRRYPVKEAAFPCASASFGKPTFFHDRGICVKDAGLGQCSTTHLNCSRLQPRLQIQPQPQIQPQRLQSLFAPETQCNVYDGHPSIRRLEQNQANSDPSIPFEHAPCETCGLRASTICACCREQFCSAHLYCCHDCPAQLCTSCLDFHRSEPHWRDTCAPRETFSATAKASQPLGMLFASAGATDPQPHT